MPSPPVSSPSGPVRARDRRWLEGLRQRYHHRRFVGSDPLAFLYSYDDPGDREVAGLIASSLAYGNVTAMRPAIAGVLDRLGTAPAAALARIRPAGLRRRLRGFRYRFTTGDQLAGLLAGAARTRRRHGSLGACLAGAATHESTVGDATVIPAIGHLVDELRREARVPLDHLLPHPAGGSACKRLCLYLRWMIRDDGVDPGGWDGIDPAALVMPLDTHVHRTALARGWTARRSADLRTALAVTAHLARICPADPLRYDFAITRPGILGVGKDE